MIPYQNRSSRKSVKSAKNLKFPASRSTRLCWSQAAQNQRSFVACKMSDARISPMAGSRPLAWLQIVRSQAFANHVIIHSVKSSVFTLSRPGNVTGFTRAKECAPFTRITSIRTLGARNRDRAGQATKRPENPNLNGQPSQTDKQLTRTGLGAAFREDAELFARILHSDRTLVKVFA